MNRSPDPTPATIHRLFAISSNRCMAPDCQKSLFENHTKLGKVAHIHASSPGGPRWDAGLTTDDVRSFENLLLLCGEHHDLVDGDPARYPADLLIEWRQEREREAHPVTVDLLGNPEVFTALLEWALDAGYAPGPEDWSRQPKAPSFLLSLAGTRREPPWLFECTITQQGGDPLAVIRAKWNGAAIVDPTVATDFNNYEPRNHAGKPSEWRLPAVRVNPSVSGTFGVVIEFWFAGTYRTQTWEWDDVQRFQTRDSRIIRT